MYVWIQENKHNVIKYTVLWPKAQYKKKMQIITNIGEVYMYSK